MLDAVPHMRIACMVAEEFEVSPRTVHKDIRLFRVRWDKDERKLGIERRARVIRAMERNARACRKAGDLKGERDALYKLARLLGMGVPNVTVKQDNRTQVVAAVFDRAASDELLKNPETRGPMLQLLEAHVGAEGHGSGSGQS